MKVQVAYATPVAQVVLAIVVPSTCTVLQAIVESGILQQFPEINLEGQAVGIFNKIKSLTHVLQADDRIEIYRPLTIEPKQARLARAQKKA